MLAIIFLTLFVIVSCVTLIDLKFGFIAVLICRVLIPSSVRVSLGPIDTPFNNLLILVLIVSLLISVILRPKKLESFNNFWFYKPFAIFFVLMLLLTPFAMELPFGETLKNYLQLLVTQFSLALIGWFVFSQKEDVYIAARNLLLISILIGVYGVYCYVTLSNPYITLINLHYAPDLDTLSFMEKERGGLEGRIQGTMGHPLAWGGACMLLFYFFNQDFIKGKKVFLFGLLGVLVLNVLFSGSRAALLTVAVGLAYIFLRSSIRVKIRFALYSSLAALFLVVLLYQVPQLKDYQEIFEATFMFWDTDQSSDSQEIRGSSVEMRISQFYGSFEMIKDSLLTGLGQGYTLSYSAKFGPHPVMRGFESIVFMGLVETGIIGMLLWLFLFYSLFKLTLDLRASLGRPYRFQIILLQAYFFSYVVFILFTGFQGTLFLFLALFVLILKYVILSAQQSYLSEKNLGS